MGNLGVDPEKRHLKEALKNVVAEWGQWAGAWELPAHEHVETMGRGGN